MYFVNASIYTVFSMYLAGMKETVTILHVFLVLHWLYLLLMANQLSRLCSHIVPHEQSRDSLTP